MSLQLNSSLFSIYNNCIADMFFKLEEVPKPVTLAGLDFSLNLMFG